MKRSIIRETKLHKSKLEIVKAQTQKTSTANPSPMRKKNVAWLTLMLTATGVLLFSSNLHATPLSTVNAYIGIAKTIKSVLGKFIGETTVTPACALGTWDHYDYGIYGLTKDGKPNYFGRALKVWRNPITGRFFYRTLIRDPQTGKWQEADREPIDIPRLAKLT